MTHVAVSHAKRMLGFGCVAVAIAGITAAASGTPQQQFEVNPHPVHLLRPRNGPLSTMARLGKGIFFDGTLSSSGRISCASCHRPQNAYGPPNDLPVMNGGANLAREGVRAVPSLMYLDRTPGFSVGPDSGEGPDGAGTPLPSAILAAAHARKTADNPAGSATNLVPQGGLFWDGRADTLQDQALGPLLNPIEMDGGSIDRVAAKLRKASYAPLFVQLFGPNIVRHSKLVVSEALFAVGRYQVESVDFHPYSSKYDAWLEGKARFSSSEARGYQIFNDPQRANCAGCHLSAPTTSRLPPLFTDHQFEALGVPRNAKLIVNRTAAYADLGVCGPIRDDMKTQRQFCGMFATPTLRNVATRHAFFHNGVYDSLGQVLDFYDFRDTKPQRVYPTAPDGRVMKYNDLPPRDRRNVDTIDAPFDRTAGAAPAMTHQEELDVIAFLRTLTDGYRAGGVKP